MYIFFITYLTIAAAVFIWQIIYAFKRLDKPTWDKHKGLAIKRITLIPLFWPLFAWIDYESILNPSFDFNYEPNALDKILKNDKDSFNED